MTHSGGKPSRRERFKNLLRFNSPSSRAGEGSFEPAAPSTLLQVTGSGEPKPTITSKVDHLSAVDPGHLQLLRNNLWKRTFENLRAKEPELVGIYETLIKADADVDQNADTFTPEVTSTIVRKQRARMEAKQWTYSWFGKSQKVRDTAESILTTVKQISGPISAGMSAAPPFVSLPWSMSISLIAFVMSDFEVTNSAIEGLETVTAILASYSYAEQEFLLDDHTKKDFEDAVIDLYTSILEYQVLVSQYFAKNTLKRLGLNTLSAGKSWSESLEKVQQLEKNCQIPLAALGVRLTKQGFNSIEGLLCQGTRLMEQISHSVISERTQREKIVQWISPISHLQDHSDIRNFIGDSYLGSGQWLLHDTTEYLPWRASTNGLLLLRGIVGSGKTSLTSIVIQNLLERDSVAFFYCSANASPYNPTRTVHNDNNNKFNLTCYLAPR